MDKKINGIDFIDRINQLEESYLTVIATKNFFSDYPTEIRYAVNAISDGAFYNLKESVKKAENTLLIDAYTISEQMLKHAKYQLLNFDETEKTDYQLFLNYKVSPEKFSPNPKVDEINKFLRRYNSEGLLFKKLPLYDQMIRARHRYAHSGDYQFDISDFPKIIEILRYLEFEYRMFLLKSSWFELPVVIKKCGGKGISKTKKQSNYESQLDLLIRQKTEILQILKEENMASRLLTSVFELIVDGSKITEVESGFTSARNIAQDDYS